MTEHDAPSAGGNGSARPETGPWNFELDRSDEPLALKGAIVGRAFGNPLWIAEARRHGLEAREDGLDEAAAHERWLQLSDRFAAHVATIPEVFAGMRPGPELRSAMEAAFQKAYRKGRRERPDVVRPSRPLSMAALAGKPVPVLRYAAGDWIPWAKPVLFSGRGGGGKTTLGSQLGAARAIGQQWLGLDTPPGRTLAILCEDDEDDAHRMLARLASFYGRRLEDFEAFHYWARLGQENALVTRLRNGGRIVSTPFYVDLAQYIGDLKPDLLFLDNAAHVALINENDRGEVTAAWGLLHGLMAPTGGTTLLGGHTPKNGNAEFSGSTAWENVARSRLYLGPTATDADEQPVENDPRRTLRRGKANASGTASMDIVWDQGAFRLAHPEIATYGDQLAREMRIGAAGQVFLDAIDRLTAQQRSTSATPAARNYAPRLIKAAGLAGDFSAKELAEAMEALFRDGRIIAAAPMPWRDSARRPVAGIGRP